MTSWWRRLPVFASRPPRRQHAKPWRRLGLGVEKFEERRLLAGFDVTESSGSTLVWEAGMTDTFSVVLTAEPESDVVLLVASADTTEATVSPSSLRFTPADWNSPQAVRVSGAEDSLADGNQTTLITIAVDADNSADSFDAVPPQAVTVTTTDNDIAGFTLSRFSAFVSESGSTDTFTVVLTAQPYSDVTLAVTSADAGEVTVTPASVTFTPGNWNAPQAVTLQGVDDHLVDGPQTTLVTVSVDDAASDDSFDPLADQSVSVFTVDDDAAGMTVSKNTAMVSEAGSTDTFTVVLTAQPDTNVVVTVTSSDLTEVTASPATLVFSAANWDVPQTVTATGVDDTILDGIQMTAVTMSVADSLSDDKFDNVPNRGVVVFSTDDDVAGFSVGRALASVSESGTTDTFAVQLSAQPDTDVTLSVTSGDTGEATVSPASLTFTPTDWNLPQTVTVTGVDDFLIDGSQVTDVTISVDGAASDSDFAEVSDQAVTVTTTDDDVAGFTLSRTAVTVSESGSSDTFTVVLTAQPDSYVSLTAIHADLDEATVSPMLLTFTAADWSIPQTITVTGVDDHLVDGNQLTLLTVSVADDVSDDAFDMVLDQTVYVTTTNDDEAGFTRSKTAATVSEGGTTDTFTVVLTAQPDTDVRLTVTSGDTGEATVSPAALTFTPAGWNVPQTVTIAGVDEHLVDGNQLTQVTVSVSDAFSDDHFDALADQSVFVTTTDDDKAGFTLSKTAATVSESGTSDTFTVVLTAMPLADVVLTVISGDSGEASANPTVLIFTPSVWNSPQTVTITGVDDSSRDGNQVTSVTVGVDEASSDDAFDSVGDQTVSVTTSDNDLSWYNSRNPFDVDGNGLVNASDVLVIINYINADSGAPALPPPPASPPPYYDVNNDGLCTAIDVLIVINYINSHPTPPISSGEGEDASRAPTPPDAGIPVASGEPIQLVSANVPLAPVPSSSLQITGESSSRSTIASGILNEVPRPAIASNPTPRSTPVLVLRAADPTEPATASRAASRESQSLEAALEEWEPGIEDDLLAVLAQDLRGFW